VAHAVRGLPCRPSTRPEDIADNPMGLEFALQEDEQRRAALIGAMPVIGSREQNDRERSKAHLPFGGFSPTRRTLSLPDDEPKFEFVSDRVDAQYEVRMDDVLGIAADAFSCRHLRRKKGMMEAAHVLADWRLPTWPGAIPSSRWDSASLRLRLEGPRGDETAAALDHDAASLLSKSAFTRVVSTIDGSVTASQTEELWRACLSASCKGQWRAAQVGDFALDRARRHPAVVQMRRLWAQ